VSLRIAVLVKQIPTVAEMQLGDDGRLVRAGRDTEMNAYCRRAVAKAVELAAEHGGSCTVLTLGPEPAEDVLREALAWADRHGVEMNWVHACDPLFAGSDTLATALALTALLRREGPFDLVICGRNSLDAGTGQVGPQVAELLNLPFVSAVLELHYHPDAPRMRVRCQHDDGWVTAEVALPAVLSTAERLTDPCKMDPTARATVHAARIERVRAADLGPGPWGDAASPIQMATMRAGALPIGRPRHSHAPIQTESVRPRGGVEVHGRDRDDDLDTLATADAVIGIGSAVPRDDHELLGPLLKVLNAELAATRKVTDRGDLPRARQIGITGRSVAPRLYIALAASGKFNHTVGIQRSHIVVAVNTDPSAPIFDCADIGLVADWREVVALLPAALEAPGVR
jgi:electron transfer flavoprotein alpha subunit